MDISTEVPEDIRRSIASLAEGAIVNAEGGFGAGELQYFIEGVAEELTSLCKTWNIFYREVNYITIEQEGGYEDIQFVIWSNQQWPTWEREQ